MSLIFKNLADPDPTTEDTKRLLAENEHFVGFIEMNLHDPSSDISVLLYKDEAL